MELPSFLYSRIETLAGGVWSSDTAFIRAAWKLMTNGGKAPDERDLRRKFYKALFQVRDKCRAQFTQLRL